MFRNFLKITLVNLWKNRFYSLINIIGLSLGIAIFAGIYAYTVNELSYDKHHRDADKIYRLKLKGQMSGTSFEAAVTGAPVGEMLYKDLPEVTLFTRLIQYPRAVLFEFGENRIYQEGILYADSSFFNMFSYNVRGDINGALKEPYSLVMTESTAKKYFGEEDPLEKEIRWNHDKYYTVRAVIMEPVLNSHIGFEVLVSRSSLYSNPIYESLYNSLFGLTNYNYIRCNTTNQDILTRKCNEIFEKYAGETLKETGTVLELGLQPITRIHLNSDITHEITPNGNRTTVYVFIIVAILIILISSINYINLSIAQSSSRYTEVAVRKLFGSAKSSIFIQFLGETLVIGAIGVLLGYFILRQLSPMFENISHISFSRLLDQLHIGLMFLIFCPFLAIIAGFYPAWNLSGVKPLAVLKGQVKKGPQGFRFRNTMIIIQFSISIFLLACTLLIFNQMSYVQKKDPGFDQENVMIVSLRTPEMNDAYTTLRDKLLEMPMVREVTASSAYIGDFNQRRGFYRSDQSRKNMMMILNLQCEDNFLDMMGINIVKGRNFLPGEESDRDAIIVNETLVKDFNLDDPMKNGFHLPSGETEDQDPLFKIVGVCKDFHYASLHQEVKPLIIWKDPQRRRYLSIRSSEMQDQDMVKRVTAIWDDMFPGFPIEYFFLQERYGNLYRQDINTAHVFLIFTILAVIIACLGVYGLTAYTTAKRQKEIGIRKVMGGSRKDILKMINRDYLVPFLISALVALPAAWYFIHSWLRNFPYTEGVNFYILILSPLIVYIVSLFAVNINAEIASTKNPVDSIRYE